jgi:polar amino acid transport system substrate-binding protein
MKSVLLLWLIVSSLLGSTDDKVIRLAADEWCPHNCEEQSAHPGYMVELAIEAFKLYGYRVEYIVEKSWQEAIDKARSGEYNGVVGTAKSDVPDFIFPKTALGIADNCYLARFDSSWKYNGIDSLSSKRLGVIVDYTYGDRLNHYIFKNQKDPRKIQFVSGNNAIKYSLTKVKQGKLDAYVDECRVINYALLSRQDKASFKIVGKMGDVDNLYIAFSPQDSNSQFYAAMLEKGIEQLKKSRRYHEILKSYGITGGKL